jgi:hypothetical protein
MPSMLLVCLALVQPAPTTQPPASPRQQYDALDKRYQEAFERFRHALAAARTEAERRAAADLFPKPQDYVPGMLALALKYPEDPVAVPALVFAATQGRESAEGRQARSLLLERHAGHPRLAVVLRMMAYSDQAHNEGLLRSALGKAQGPANRAAARMALAEVLRDAGAGAERPARRREAEGLFDEVARDYGGVEHGRVARQARSALFELRRLQVGMVAPDIEGEDVDGKRFKLSDYRGKVVMLDFWGHW